MSEAIAVLTSGGDAPGMNAAVRAVVRTGIFKGYDVIGIYGGYQGLLDKKFEKLGPRSVSNIIQKGGTILRTSRSPEFRTAEGLQKAVNNLKQKGITKLVTIGGDGTFRGARDLAGVWDGQIVAVPGTIDNDIYGTDYTIGFDTAVNTAVEAIDKVRDTADAHERFFIIEVMGRDSGFIAMNVGVATGAEEVAIPEVIADVQEMCARLDDGWKRGKASSIIIVAEGNKEGNAFEIAQKFKEVSKCEYRVVILGYLQRGGSPSAADRILATKLGAFAVDALAAGKTDVMVGETKDELCTVPLIDAIEKKKPLDPFLQDLLPILSI